MGRFEQLSRQMKTGEGVQALPKTRFDRMREEVRQEGVSTAKPFRPVPETKKAQAASPAKDARKAKRDTSTATAVKAPVQRWENQLRQAQVDQDTDVILRLNKKLKEERARRGKQTLGDRVSDAASAVFGGSGGSLANLAGFASNLAQDPAADRRQIARLQQSLKTGRTTDGRPINDAQRKTIQDAISRLDASARKREAPDSFTNRAYRAADRMADTGAAFQESAKKGLGKVGSTVVDAAVSMGQSTLDAALGAATGTGMLPFVARSLGGGAQEARRGGADLDEQLLYGSAQSAKEYVTEKLFGLAVPQKMLGKAGAGSLDGAIETGIRNVTERLAKTPGGQKFVGGLLTWLAGGATEGLEEGIGSVIENTLISPNLREWDPDQRTRQQKFEDALYDMLVGGVSGLMGVTNLGGYQVSPAVRAQYAARQTETAPGARQTSGAGVDTTQAQSPAEAVQMGPRDVLMEAARRGGKLKEGPDMQKELARFQLKEAGTADSVKPEGIMEREIRRLFGGGKRLSPDTLTAEQMAAVEAANGLGTVDMDAENRLYQVNPEEHIDRRDIQSAGDKRLRAFQFDHPQLHPYYVQAAQALSAELEHYMPGGETASRVSEDGNAYSYRMRRSATPRIAELIDRYGVKPGQIGRAIEAIINDQGQENYAAAKRLELMLDEMLTDGYQDALSGEAVQPNREYIDLKGKIAGAMDRAADMGHGLDGIGAADAGSLNSDYDRLQAQSSRFHPEGPNAARPVDVPTQDFDGRNVSKSASTIMGAKILDDADVVRLEQLVADGGFSFDTIHDKDALQRARDTVQAVGFDRALERYIQTAQANTATKDNTVLGQVLMLEAARGGNRNALAEIAALYARNSTNIAQAMQAQNILQQLGPEARLYNLQKSVNELAEKYQVDIELDQTALDDFVNAGNEEARQEAEARLIQSAASQLPTTFRAKYDAVRYLAMLGNPRTHIRNILGNFFFQIPATLKNRVGAVGEVTARALGADVERTKSLTGASPFGALAREARADWANAKPFLEGGKYSEGKVTSGTIEQEAKPFQNSGALGKAVGLAADKNASWLETEDRWFKQWTYSQSLAGYLQANGVKSIDQADPALLNRARNYAAQEALRNTFNDKNAFSDWIAKAGNARNSKNPFAKGASYVVEGVLPFKRTPANVLARAVEYSPVGAAASIADLMNKGARGQATQETIVRDLDRLAAGLSGSALLGLGVLLSGMISGGEDPAEDQRRFDDLTGHQNYALELDNGTSITLDWLAPSAIPFFMGVELAHAWQDDGLTPEEALNALKSIGEPMLEMSMLQGLNDVFEDAAYAQQHGGSVPAALLVSASTNYLTQAAPTLFGQLERSAEGRRMTTYGDKNSPLSQDAQFFLGKLSQKVPGWDYHQIPYLDAWGREEETGDALQRAFNNMINPAYVSQVRVDQVERELQRLKDATGNGGVFPDRAKQYFTVDGQRKDLTAEEYQKYAKTVGQTQFSLLEKLMEQPGYQRMDDTQRQKAIAAVYEYASGMGKLEVSSWNPDSSSIVKEALKSPLPTETYILYRVFADRDGNGNVSGAESAQTLMELDDLTDKQRGEAWNAFNDVNEAKNPFTGALSKKLDPEEALTAWGIYDRRGTKEEPYTQERKKQDLRQELGLSYIDADQMYELMEKAAKGK